MRYVIVQNKENSKYRSVMYPISSVERIEEISDSKTLIVINGEEYTFNTTTFEEAVDLISGDEKVIELE